LARRPRAVFGAVVTSRRRAKAPRRAAFAEFLAGEEKAGRLMQVRHSLYVLPKRSGFASGVLQMNERGFGFLVPIDPANPISISRAKTPARRFMATWSWRG
jgi:hypothetical protein